MKHLIFKVVIKKPIDIDFDINFIRKYPVHSHFLIEEQEKTIVYKYEPTKSLDEEKYIEALTNYLKQKYKAYSVTTKNTTQ